MQSQTTSPAQKHALILVVERDPHVRELEEFLFRKAGWRVELVKDGVEALERIRDQRPAVVITEVLVPRLDGLALCRRIREDPAMEDTRILVLSVLAAGHRALEAGADAFLRKPLLPSALLDRVRELLESPSTEPRAQEAR